MESDSAPPRPIQDGSDPGRRATEPGAIRLPPPMFPPGARRPRPRRATSPVASTEDDGVPHDAFILPDDVAAPSWAAGRRGDALPQVDLPEVEAAPGQDAFLEPEPMAVGGETAEPAFEDMVLGSAFVDLDDVLVTGIGDDPHLEDEGLPGLETFRDIHLAELVRALDRLAGTLRSRGEVGLKATRGMTRFEATLRAYCVGYLAGVRESAES